MHEVLDVDRYHGDLSGAPNTPKNNFSVAKFGKNVSTHNAANLTKKYLSQILN